MRPFRKTTLLGGKTMPDDLKKKGKADRKQVSKQPWEQIYKNKRKGPIKPKNK
jgi:hypothetical protein